MSSKYKAKELAEAADILSLPDEPKPQQVQRRRTEDEMRRALALLIRGEPLPRDDESPLVLSDAVSEVLELRRTLMDIMQGVFTTYQLGLSRVREMTDH